MGHWRSQVSVLVLVGTAVLVACGGGESGEESSDGSSAAAVSESSVVDLTTTTEGGFDPSTLEGPIALESSACDGGFDDAALEGVDSVEEAVAALEQSGFDTTAVICAMDPDGGNLRQVSALGHEARYPGFTDDGESLYWFDVTVESWIVARADGTDPQPWESTTDFPWRRSPDGASYTNTSWGEPGFFVTKTGEQATGPSRRHLVATADACCDTFRWSPDSRSILFYSTAGAVDCPRLMKVDVESGEQSALAGRGSPSEDVPVCAEFGSARWSPDGSTILFHDYDGVRTGTTPFLMDADGRNLRPLLPDGSVSDPEWMALGSAWSRDGRAVVLGIVETMSQGTYLVPLDGTSPVRIGGPEAIALAMATQFAWAPTSPSF